MEPGNEPRQWGHLGSVSGLRQEYTHTQSLDRRLWSLTALHVIAFCADSAALPATMSAMSTATFGGKVNSHCSASGAFPSGDSSVSSKDPDPPRVHHRRRQLVKVCAQAPAETSTKIKPPLMFTSLHLDGLILTRTACHAPMGAGRRDANKNGRPISYRAAVPQNNDSQGLRLTLTAVLRQAQISYDGTQQDHGTRFRCVDQKLLHRE